MSANLTAVEWAARAGLTPAEAAAMFAPWAGELDLDARPASLPVPQLPAELAAAGWQLGPPDQPGIADTVAIDAEVAAHARCGRCRCRGLAFVPLHRAGLCSQQYGGLWQCVRCGWQEEA